MRGHDTGAASCLALYWSELIVQRPSPLLARIVLCICIPDYYESL